MAYKQHRNALCSCGSGIKYKFCCGKDKPLKGNTLTFLGDDKTDNDIDRALKDYTGYHPNSYIQPVKSKAPLIYILIDESKNDNFYAMSGIVYEANTVGNLKVAKTKLRDLADEFEVDYFHFVDILGKRKIFGDRVDEFIYRYSEIVSKLKVTPFSFCRERSEVEKMHNRACMNDKEIYTSIQWELIDKILVYLVWKYGPELIIHMMREQENITEEKARLHYINAKQVQEKYPFAQISFYKYYDIFMKTEILNSSLSDLVAYTSTRIKKRMSIVDDDKKIVSQFYRNLLVLSLSFSECGRIDIDNFCELLGRIKRQEEARKNRLK